MANKRDSRPFSVKYHLVPPDDGQVLCRISTKLDSMSGEEKLDFWKRKADAKPQGVTANVVREDLMDAIDQGSSLRRGRKKAGEKTAQQRREAGTEKKVR